MPFTLINPSSPSHNGLNSIIDEFFDNFSSANSRYYKNSNRLSRQIPMANISKDSDNYKIDIAAPGLSREDFTIKVEENRLIVSSESSDQEQNAERKEFNYSNFQRSWILPKGIKAEMITANYNAGILSMTIPTEKNKDKSVYVNVD